MVYSLVIIAIVLATIIPLIILKNKLNKKHLLLSMKVLAIVLFSLGILRCFLSDSFIWIINGGTYDSLYYQSSDVVQSLLRWGLFLSYIVFPCAMFFKHRTLKNFAIYFCMPVAIISLFFYNDFLSYFTIDSGRAIMTADWFRHFEFMLELIITILLPLMIRFLLGHKFDVKNKTEWINFFGLLPLALLIVMPVVLPQSLFGFTNKYMIPLSFPNILWIIIIFAIFIILYFAFRYKDRETRYMICIFLALYLFLHYNSIYLMDLKMSRLPFQLCNLGSYLILIALLVKKQWFFDFCLLANVPGAMIAFCVPDVGEGMLSYWNIHFYIEHTWVFVIPLLAVALRIMDRPSKKSLKSYFIGFSIYFLFCAISGIIVNSYLYIPNHSFFNEINYFYLFNTTVLEVLPFLGFTRSLKVTLNGYAFYPLYMLLIYILYSVFCMVVYYVYLKLCKVGDDHFKMRNVRIDLHRERGKYKKRKKEPKQYYID